MVKQKRKIKGRKNKEREIQRKTEKLIKENPNRQT